MFIICFKTAIWLEIWQTSSDRRAQGSDLRVGLNHKVWNRIVKYILNLVDTSIFILNQSILTMES